MDILDFFPRHLTPRDVQAEALSKLQENWHKADVFVLNLPVASGKSAIAETIQAWLGAGKAAVLTPSNILLDQYAQSSKLRTYFGKDAVACHTDGFDTCQQRYAWKHIKANKNNRKITKYCKECPYAKLERYMFFTKANFNYITNYYKYVSMKQRTIRTATGQLWQGKRAIRDCLIIDEAHNLVDFIKEFNSSHIWAHDFPYQQFPSRRDLVAALKEVNLSADGTNPYQDFIDRLELNPPRFILKHEDTTFFTKPASRLNLTPVSAAGLSSPVWDKRTKLVLMSATISSKDIEEMGLAGRRVYYIQANSCIPSDSRPVINDYAGWIKAATLQETSTKVAIKAMNISNSMPDSKGLVHATYKQASYLRGILGENKRFIFHDRDNKAQKYQEFRDTSEPKILVASGMYEGVDLPYEAGRFQLVAKIPYPNLGEPAIRYQTSQDQKWFSWQAVKQVLQACGRICRTPEDYGETYILDANFRNLYSNNQEMFPDWFKESVRGD